MPILRYPIMVFLVPYGRLENLVMFVVGAILNNGLNVFRYLLNMVGFNFNVIYFYLVKVNIT